jgi:methylated-DNA-[protein]-cysteine S-methyltransferase
MMSAPPPIGLLFLARTSKGLRYVEFMDRKSLKRMIAAHEAELPDAAWEPSLLELKSATEQLEAYFLGTLRDFELPLDPVGSEFQHKVWGALRRIPYGETRTYGEIAAGVKQPKASRAVGLANHENPLAVVVPCHRVVGANRVLGGYGGGVHRKRWLLEHEARQLRPVGRQGDLFAVGGGRRGAR